jgi:hypothetical protein
VLKTVEPKQKATGTTDAFYGPGWLWQWVRSESARQGVSKSAFVVAALVEKFQREERNGNG